MVQQAHDVPNLVNNDKIVVTVTYRVAGLVVSQKVYVWTLIIPTPELIDVAYSPGGGSPAFSAETLDYTLTLPVGTTSTAATLSKTPGVLNSLVVHRRPATATDVTICTDCAYDQVPSQATYISCSKSLMV